MEKTEKEYLQEYLVEEKKKQKDILYRKNEAVEKILDEVLSFQFNMSAEQYDLIKNDIKSIISYI